MDFPSPKTLLALLLGVMLTFCGTMPAGAQADIKLYVEGELVEPDREGTIHSGAPKLVEGHAMLPIRMLSHVLGLELEVWMLKWGGIMKMGPFYFKVGEKGFARAPVPAIGGNRAEGIELPIAPRIIESHYYVPAPEVLEYSRCKVKWDARKRALRVTLSKELRQRWQNLTHPTRDWDPH